MDPALGRPVPHILAENAAAAPWKPALLVAERNSWRQLSRGDLLAYSEAWGAELYDKRPITLNEKQRVAIILLRHGVDAYCAYLGAMRAGLIPCFMPFPTPKQDAALYWQIHREVFGRIDPAIVITYGQILNEVREIAPAETIVMDVAVRRDAPLSALPPLDDIIRNDAPALLQHSSGTTGLKKGVVLTHEQIGRQLAAYSRSLSMTQNDKVASWLPLYHDMGLITGFLLPLACGATIISMDAFEWVVRPDILLHAIKRFRATLCWLPNFAFAHLIRTAEGSGDYDLSSVRAFINCSEPCKAETFDRFEDRFMDHGLQATALQTCYAMAETVFAVTQTDLAASPRTIVADQELLVEKSIIRFRLAQDGSTMTLLSCGRALNATSLRIVPPALARIQVVSRIDIAPADEASLIVGEVQIRCSSMFSGYFGEDARSANVFDDGWYRSGDLGFIHDGELFITGRIKELIIVHGRNFYAHDIEAIVSRVTGVKPGRVVAFGSYREAAGSEEAIIVAELIDQPANDSKRIKRAIKDAVFRTLGLTLYRVELIAADQLIKTTSGKLCREENRRRFNLSNAA